MSSPGPHPRLVQSFMTHALPDADVRALSTGREKELDRVMGAIRRSRKASPGTLQHVIVYGARGFGKSFMMRRVQIELARSGGDGSVHFVLLPEEQHNLQRSPHAFLETIALGVRDVAFGTEERFAEGHFRWPDPDEDAKRWIDAADSLERTLDEALPAGCGLVVVAIENFDVLLRTLFRHEEAEQRLRQWLDRRGNRVMLLATATGTVDMDYERPLFKAFESVRLEPWSDEDCIAYFDRQRAHDGRPPLDTRQRAKARAIATFIGGTPRLAQLLAEVIESEDALSVVELMTALTDRLAEYYRHRIEDLAPLARGLLDALVRGGEPASQTQLAERVGARGQSDIARVMSDLRRSDIVRGVKAPDSRETLYRVTDRVFAHYYRRRQGGESPYRSPLETILEFLRTSYTEEERRAQALRHLDEGRVREASVFDRLAREGVRPAADRYTRGFRRRLDIYLDAVPALGERFGERFSALLESDLPAAHQLTKDVDTPSPADRAVLAVVRAQVLHRMGDASRSESSLREAARSDDRAARVIASYELGLFLLHVERSTEESATVFLALKTDEVGRISAALECARLRGVAFSLDELGCHEEAVAAAETAAGLAREAGDLEEEALSTRHKAYSLGELGRHEEALAAAETATGLAREAGDLEEEARATKHKAYSLDALGRHEEALAAAETAAGLASEAGDVGEEAEAVRLKAFLHERLGRSAEAQAALTKSLELAGGGAEPFTLSHALRQLVTFGLSSKQPDIIERFEEWMTLWQEDSIPSNGAFPKDSVADFLVATVRAGRLSEIDGRALGEKMAERGDRRAIWLHGSHGAAIARLADEDGRAAAHEAMAALLPCIAAFVGALSEEQRDRTWLVDLVSGFAGACRDPGLLRDVAVLLIGNPDPDAPRLASVLGTLAAFDEADDGAVYLARVDPDLATLVRRIRGLAEPDGDSAPKVRRGR